MPNFNQATLAGHLTRDPQTKFLAGDRQVASFGLAVSRKWKDKDGGAHDEVLFMDCEAWGKLAEIVGQYLTKGAPVLVAGRLKMDTWEDKQTGAKRSAIRLVVETLQMLGGKDRQAGPPADEGESPKAHAQPRRPEPSSGGDDEPPF